jgi:hypothetical protein
MNNVLFKPKTMLLSTLLSTSLFAAENFIEIGGGFSSSKDNFDAEGKSRNNSYNKAQSESGGIPNISFFYGYDIDDNNQIYATSQQGDLSIGYEASTDMGVFDMGIVSSLMGDETWENPFALNTSREKTDVSEIGGYFSYGLPINDQWFTNISYTFTTINFDKETVAKELRREGNRHILAWENDIGPIMLNLEYEKYDADGKQSSYDKYSLEVGSMFELSQDLSLIAMASLGQKQYDEKNQILDKKIDATIYSVYSELRYEEPFGFKNTYTSLRMGHESENANHDFYDKENTFSIISLGYKF